jgi:hypothetical protein
MIRSQSESDFPDVDRMLDEAAASKPVLGYQGPDVAREQESPFLPLARFARRVGFIGGCAALAGGLGLSLSRGGDGALLMALGGSLLGLILPIPGARRRNAW